MGQRQLQILGFARIPGLEERGQADCQAAFEDIVSLDSYLLNYSRRLTGRITLVLLDTSLVIVGNG